MERGVYVPALLSDQATDVRGLAAVFALSQAIAGATTVPALETALTGWAKTHLGCDNAKFLDVARRPVRPGGEEPLLEARADEPGATLSIPSPGAPTGWLAFATSTPLEGIKDSFRRLAMIASSLCAAKLEQMSRMTTLREENETLRRQAVGGARSFLGASVEAKEIARMVSRLALSSAPVLLLGEVGVGKSFAARLIHELGPRKHEPFRIVNCASIPENLMDSELFGLAGGAFEAAERGTLFLDEIGELPLASQAKLLRVLETKQFERLGSGQVIPLQARIVAATHVNLEERIAAGAFRSDLYFRISVIKAEIPPLRERGDDAILLAAQILHDLAANGSRRVRGFSRAALDAIRHHAWPGNVRELRNVIERAYVLGRGPVIEITDLPPVSADASPETTSSAAYDAGLTWVALPMNEDQLNEQNRGAALRTSGGNKTRAAALLGIRRARLYKK